MIFVIDNWVSVTVVFCIVNWSQIWQLSDNGPCVCLVIPSVVNITFSHISHQSCSSFEDTTLHLTTFTNILRERGREGLIEDIFCVMPKTGLGPFLLNLSLHVTHPEIVMIRIHYFFLSFYLWMNSYISLIKLYILYVRWDEFERWALEKVISQGEIFVCSGILLCLSDFDRS